MMIIDHRKFTRPDAATSHKKSLRKVFLYGLCGLVALFALANGAMALAYRGKVLPNYRLGSVPVGGQAYASLPAWIGEQSLLPKQITLRYSDQSKTVPVAELGTQVDTKASIERLRNTRTILPLLSVMMHHTVPIEVSVNQQQFDQAVAAVRQTFDHDPQPTRVVWNGTAFVSAEPTKGQKIQADSLKSRSIAAVEQGKTQLTVPMTISPAPAPSDVSGEVQKLQQKLTVKLSLVYNGKTITPSAKDIGNWYTPYGQTMILSPAAIQKYLETIAPSAANQSDLVLAMQYAMGKDQSLHLAVVPKGSITHSYCTAVRGASTAALDDLTGKLAATYADIRGWNDGGRIAFRHVESGCDYTVWLSASSQMTSFGSICDEYYSCQVGSSVVINEDRWNHATDPWNTAGNSIEDYHTLVIDHETGHRLGFYDNPTCPAQGGPAPVMMQQSIDLHGCTFNMWPTTAELQTLASRNSLDPLRDYTGI